MHHHNECDLYLRLSLDREGKTGIERQEADCRAEAARLGLTVRKVHIDRGRSGYKYVTRKGFDDALAAVTAGVVGTLIVWKLDRLSRKGIGEIGRVLDDLSRVGARIVSVMDRKDTSDESDRIAIALLAELARQESKNIGTRVGNAKRYLRTRGQWIGGQPPYGLMVDPETKRLTPDPDTAVFARLIADMALSGESLTGIARFLNAEEIEAPRGGEWNAGTLSQLLRAPAFAGLMPETDYSEAPDGTRKYSHRVRVYSDPTTHEPVEIGEGIISDGEREVILTLIASRTREDSLGRKRPTHDGSALLTTLIHCGVCERRMHRVGGSYRCMATRAGNRCPGANVMADAIDAYVSDAFLTRLPASEPDDPLLIAVADRWVRKADPELFAKRDAIRAELDAQESAMDRLIEDRERPEFQGQRGRERYDKAVSRIMRRTAGLEADLSALPTPAVNVGPLLDSETLVPAWEGADLDRKREYLRLAIDRVSVSKGQRGKRFNGHERVTIEWAEPADE
ncbi:recombinase family protein [Actinospica sp. MGRD01-02]|uniref:Recombinase family protein n=1 Tax=Actinospica acidithermotolerans TaxID=2828514 RepID=A0A941EBT3_9ACTN|nr:recombinase family protein [Actinospica acidithermotolerans]MBR7828646.1 recombinase family protein [Actinospica acidithermotolerans]